VVSCGDVETLAQKIAELCSSPERIAEYGLRNMEIVRARGNWRENFREFERIYESLAWSGKHSGSAA